MYPLRGQTDKLSTANFRGVSFDCQKGRSPRGPLRTPGRTQQAPPHQLITIDTIVIKQDDQGRYCLNDFHKAAGGEAKHTPGRFTITDTFKGLLVELSRFQDDSVPCVSKAGRNGGTYVAKELVYAYAMWISPQFHLKVIRAYDRLATQGVAMGLIGHL